MRTILNSERGSALLIALCLMGMLTLAALLAVNTSNTDVDLAFNQLNADKAFYIAEAGAKRGIAEIRTDRTWNSGFTNLTFGGGAFSVTIADSTTDPGLVDTIIVTSSGEANGASATVEITLIPEYIYPFRYAMFADDIVDIRNSMETDSYASDSGTYLSTVLNEYGDVGSNGIVDINNGAIINGDAVTSLAGGLSVNTGAIVTGNVTDTAPPQILDIVPQSEYDSALANNSASTGLSGSYTYDPVTHAFETDGDVIFQSGVYYFSTFTLLNSASVTLAPGAQVTIYVTGDIEIKNSGDVNPTGDPGDLIFYSQGDLVLKNSGTIHGVFYAPDGDADLRNSADFFGSIVAGEIVAHNSSGFHYDRRLSRIKKGDTGDVLLIAWKEL